MAAPEIWRDTEIPETRCPFCNHPLSAHGSPDGAAPNPGDVCVCIACASPLVIIDGLAVRGMGAAEFAALDDATRSEIRRFQAAIRAMDRREMPNG